MNLNEIDQKLITDCINRNSKAEFELFRVCYSYLMSICIRYTKNEETAKEVLNIGFYKILSNLKKHKPDTPFKAWIRVVMVNTLINEYKKEKIHYSNVQYVEDYYETDKHSDINNAIKKINANDIYEMIAQLPPASKQVFNLFYMDGFKHKEIAELLNITEGTSKWHLNSAKEKLKELINKTELQIKVS